MQKNTNSNGPVNIENLFSSFFTGLSSIVDNNESSEIYTIDEYIEKEVNLGIQLTPLQIAIPKVFYGVPLSDEELSIMEYWKTQDRVVWDFETRNHQILALEAGRRSGKCTSLDSLVISGSGLLYLHEMLGLENLQLHRKPNPNSMSIIDSSLTNTYEGLQAIGEIKELQRLSDSNTFLIDQSISVEGASQTAKAQGFFVKGVTKTKKLKTHCGYNLNGTPEHRIKILNSDGEIVWRHLQDLEPGDRACIHRSTFLFPQEQLYVKHQTESIVFEQSLHCKDDVDYPETLNSDWAYLLGLLVSNGSWTKDDVIECTYHEQDENIYVKAFSVFPGAKVVSDSRSRYGKRIRSHRKTLRKFLDFLGFNLDAKTNNKRTPWSIRQSPKDVQSAYLSGLFDGDGCVEKNGKTISFSTASEQLNIETQLLLLNFGIICHCKTKHVKGKPYYLLSLRGQRSVRRFIDEIGFRLERKQNLVIENLNKVKRDGGDTEKIPNQINWLKRLRDCLPTNTGKQPGSRKGRWGDNLSTAVLERPKLQNLREEFRSIVGNSIKSNSGEEFSAYRLQPLVDFAREHCQSDLEAVRHFEYLLECDYFYDQIESVEDSKAYCVDLSVPGHEQYVSQGFTNHNTLLAALIGSYEFYKLCRLPNPQEFFQIAYSTPISILVLATSAKQGKQTIFGNILGIIQNSPFFKRLEESNKLFIGREEIRFDEKRIGIFAGNSKSSSQVGGTLKAFIMDEFARFHDVENSDGEETQAMELWSNLGISGSPFKDQSVRVAISSAWEEGDPIQQLQKDVKDDPNAVSFNFCSWHMNPIGAARDNPVVESEYRRNPIAAALEFEGIRPQVASSFFNSVEVEHCFRGSSVMQFAPMVITGSSGKKMTGLEVHSIEKCQHLSILSLDPAVKLDGYAGALGRNVFDEQGRRIVVVDDFILWEPEHYRPVCFQNVQDVILQIHKHRPLAEVVTDHHGSSEETIQRLEEHGISCRIKVFSNRNQLEMYDLTRKLMHEERLIFPKLSRFKATALRELIRVMLVKGQKIDHPSHAGESKDIADAVVSLVDALTKRLNMDKVISASSIICKTRLNHSSDFPRMEPPTFRKDGNRPSARAEFQKTSDFHF